MAANVPGARKVDNGFRVKRTRRDFDASPISPSSGSKHQHAMLLDSHRPRHQRLELSVLTAMKFYFVQDMLGFDQPSQAVEWLIEKADAAIRELPQPSSNPTSYGAQYVNSSRGAVTSSCVQNGDLNTYSQENTSTDSEDRPGNLHEQILAASNNIGQKSSRAKTRESDSIDSIGQGEKREQRSVVMRSVASNRRTRETDNGVPPKEFKAKARERCRQRTKPKDKSYSQQSGISGMWQKSCVYRHYPTFCLQENTTPPSSMMNETTDGNSSCNALLHGLMLPGDSILCNHSGRCVSSVPAEIQCSSHPTVHHSAPKQLRSSIQSTGAFSKTPFSNT